MTTRQVCKALFATFAFIAFLTGCGGGSSSASTPQSGITRVAVQTDGSRIYSQSIYVNNGDKPVYTANFVQPNPRVKLKEINFSSWQEYVAARPSLDPKYKATQTTHTTSVKTAASSSYNADDNQSSLIAVGYIPSTQQWLGGATLTPNEQLNQTACYLASGAPQIVSNVIANKTSLQNTTDTSALSQTMNVSASASGSYGAFSAHASASYSNQYQSNTQSGMWTAVAGIAGVVSTNVNATGNLTQYALDIIKNQGLSAFYNACGSNALSQYLGGVLVSQTTQFNSSSQSDMQQFNANMGGSYSGASASAAFGDTNTTAGATLSMSMSFQSYGDQQINSAQFLSDMIATAIDGNSTTYTSCVGGSMQSCSAYASAMSTAIQKSLADAEPALTSQTNPYAPTSLYPFVNGLNVPNLSPTIPPLSNQQNGQYATYVTPSDPSITSGTFSDPYASFSSSMVNAAQNIFQLNTLAARAYLLQGVPGFDTNASGTAINKLASYYSADASAILSAFKQCIGNTSTCGNTFTLPSTGQTYSIDGNFSSIASPYQLYSQYRANNATADLLAQNYITLQYDVVYLEQSAGNTTTEYVSTKGTTIATYAVGNSVNFGLVYYNYANVQSEFYNGAGYIMPVTNAPYFIVNPQDTTTLSSPFVYEDSQGNKILDISAGWSISTVDKYWDINGSGAKNPQYPVSTMYFLYAAPDGGTTLPFSPGIQIPMNSSVQGKLNKVYNEYNPQSTQLYMSSDSSDVMVSSSQTNAQAYGLAFTSTSYFYVPSSFSGTNSNLQSAKFTITPTITWNTYNGTQFGCYSGVYIPGIQLNNGAYSFTNGGYLQNSNIPGNFVCGFNSAAPANNSGLYIPLGTSNSPISTKFAISQQNTGISLTFSPISSFFGF